MKRHDTGCLIIGEPGEPIVAHATSDGHVLAAGYAELLRRFGPGTFNEFLHVHAPQHVSTYGERLGMLDDAVLVRHAIFADDDNGGALSWDIELGAASPIFSFAPRGITPERIASDADALLARMSDGTLAWENGPLRAFFLPSRPHDRWHARVPSRLASRSAVDAWLDQVESRGEATLLTRREGSGFVALGFWVHTSNTIARFQHTCVTDDTGWWQLSFTTPKGRYEGVDDFLESAAAIGLEAAVLRRV